MADFNFYLNRQGIQGRKGDKGDAGFTPTISVSEQTLNSYKLKITNEYNEFETPNLIGNLGVTDNGGTYLRYNPSTGTVSTGEIDGATTEIVGGVRKSTDADLTNLSADTAVTPANVADMLPLLLEAGTDNVTITQDEATSKTKISVEGGGSGDVTAAGDNRFTGDNTFTGKVNIAGGALTVEGVANLNQATAQYLNAVSITSSGEVNAVSIKANGLRSDDIQTTENKKYLTELDVDNQTIQVVEGKLHANLDELGNEVTSLTGEVNSLTGNVSDLTGKVTANEADISAMKTDKQNKLTAGANVTLTDLTDGTVRIDATGGGGTGDIPIATTTTAGKVKPDGTTITVTEDGTISANSSYTLPTASTTQLGGVKVDGTSVTIDSNGVISAAGGASIDDNTTSTTSVWSSSKTNTEITTVDNKVAQVQGDVASLNGDVSTLKTDVSGLKTDVPTLKTDVSTLKTDVSGLKTDVSGLKTDVSGLNTSKQNTLVSGTNIKTINGETILGEGNITVGGSTPANMVTTDTDQTITGNKTFTENVTITPGTTSSYGSSYLNIYEEGGDSPTGGIRIYAGRSGANWYREISTTSGALTISASDFVSFPEHPCYTKGTGAGAVSYDYKYPYLCYDNLTAGDNISITKTENGVQISGTGGGSAPANMVTTDTAQDITANKTFYGEIRVGADNNYATLAKFSKETLQDGDSTLLEHIDLGEATFVVQGNLGKKVYETDKYVYKKYINVDDLSDNTIKMDNSISSQVAHMAMPSDKYIDLTLNATGSVYTAPADGWVQAVCNSTSNNIATIEIITEYASSTGTRYQGGWGRATVPVTKGRNFTVFYSGVDFEIKMFRFTYAVGSEPSS